MNLLELSDCMLDEIFQHLSYDEIAQKRLVSTKINKICQSLLNRSVAKLQSRIDKKVEKLKPLLPRKESQRWSHPDYKNISYLETIGVIIRVLSYSYDDYIKQNLCCFIPGKIIDMSLCLISTYPQYTYNDVHFVALRDAICMAKEHFRDYIEPPLRKLKDEKTKSLGISWLLRQTGQKLMPKEGNIATFKPLTQNVTKPPVAIPMDTQQNSKKCQGHADCQKAYLNLNRKYNAVLTQVKLTNKKYNELLRKVNLSSKAIKKQSNSQKEVADLRRRLEKLESQSQCSNGERTGTSHLVTKTNLKKVLRSSKRLADDDESQNRNTNSGERSDENHLVANNDVKKVLRSSKRLAAPKK